MLNSGIDILLLFNTILIFSTITALCFVLYQKVSMQWTCHLVVETGTCPHGELMVLLMGGGGKFVSQGSSSPLHGGLYGPEHKRTTQTIRHSKQNYSRCVDNVLNTLTF